MDNVWTNLGNRLETAWKRPTRPNSKRPKDGELDKANALGVPVLSEDDLKAMCQ